MFLPSAAQSPAGALLATVLLSLLGIAGWFSLAPTAGGSTLESFRLRAGTRSRVVASLYSGDTRSVLLARREAKASRPLFGRIRLPAPATPYLAVVWRGALALSRSPGRLAWGVALAAGGALLLAGESGRPALVWLGSLALYLAASSLLEPLRMEVDRPVVSQVLLPWQYGRVLWFHCLLPAALLAGSALVATAVGLTAGYLSLAASGLVVVFAGPAALTVVLAAALSARRGGKVPLNLILMTGTDNTGLSMLGVAAWMGAWAIASTTLVSVAVSLLSRAAATPGAPTLMVTEIAAFVAAAVFLQRLLISSHW